MDYEDFLASKQKLVQFQSVPESEMPKQLFDYQVAIIKWALRKGRACIFAGTGLGKTIMELVWADAVAKYTGKPVLILAPLAVADQIVAEAERFGLHAERASTQSECDQPIIYVTNYAKLARFPNGECFGGIVLDESSIIKHHDGGTKKELIDFAQSIQFRLASTATPAPNDWMELASHAEFLGVCSRAEMLATYFVHDGAETQKWRLKGHAGTHFWKWVCEWAVLLQSPSDLGYDGSMHVLPKLEQHLAMITSDQKMPGELFVLEAQTLQERLKAKRITTSDRVEKAKEIVNANPDETWVVWCHLNGESEALAKAIPSAVELRGNQTEEKKEQILRDFANGKIKVLISKPSMCGFGLNWQHCARMVFVGLNDSWEQVYQAIRRCWRFGQKRDVHIFFVAADIEGNVVANIERKDKQAKAMALEMIRETSVFTEIELKRKDRLQVDFRTDFDGDKNWEMRLGDCVEETKTLSSNSIDYSIYSPPFASLYTYSASTRDMGNTKNDDEFLSHYRFLVKEIFRVTKPGRLTSFHCMNLPSFKGSHGEIGLRDFRGELIRIHVEEGWVYHSEVCIWKDPVVAMQRTKAIGLLWKQLKKDSCMSRQGIPDYLVTLRKPGVNANPVEHDPKDFPVLEWQKIASPIWMDINPSNTLQKNSAREDADERHICPLQLEVIRRSLRMYSNPNDLVLSPFGGIGSEGYVSLSMDRRFIGIELKESYWKQACANLKNAIKTKSKGLFDPIDAELDLVECAVSDEAE